MGQVVINIKKENISYEDYQALKSQIEEAYKEEDGYKTEINFYE